jgi:hypothetical protein
MVALAAVAFPMSSAFAGSCSVVVGRVLSQAGVEGDPLSPCGDLKAEEICMMSWFRWTIQIERTLSGPPITGRIATANIQHGYYEMAVLKRIRLFVLRPIEDAQTRGLLKADYYLAATTCPLDTRNPDIDAILNEK